MPPAIWMSIGDDAPKFSAADTIPPVSKLNSQVGEPRVGRELLPQQDGVLLRGLRALRA